jgi:hypothetical protein
MYLAQGTVGSTTVTIRRLETALLQVREEGPL